MDIQEVGGLMVDLLREGTVRGVLISMAVGVLLYLSRKGWHLATLPRPVSQMAQEVVEHLLGEGRVEDSHFYHRTANGVRTPVLEVCPKNAYLGLLPKGDNVWEALSRRDRKAVRRAHRALAKALRERDRVEEAAKLEEKVGRVTEVLRPFRRGERGA